MSEDTIQISGLLAKAADDVGSAEAVTAARTAGQLLRQAREAQGLHIAALAVKLKVPVKRLEALEADRYQDLPGAVFTRALASSVCRSIHLEPQQVLGLLPQVAAPVLNAVEPTLNAPFKGGSSGGTSPFAPTVSRPALVLVISLILATLILVGWPWLSEHLPGLGSASDRSAETANATAVQTATPIASVVAEVPAPAAVQSSSVAPTSMPAPEQQPTAAPASQPVVVAPATPSVTGAPTAELTLKARGTVWIKVQDAQGTVLASKTLFAGDALPVSGAAPLSVVLGKADAVEVVVQGKPLDVLAIARDNVARFEVK
ncbi:MAG: hypothetical protein RLZZ591_2520 [Pseudomonadota bacterium]|jgi:cytoskeleton protein RodZ